MRKASTLTILLLAVLALVFAGCSQTPTTSDVDIVDNTQEAGVAEPTAAEEEEIINDVVVEENPEDVEIGSLI